MTDLHLRHYIQHVEQRLAEADIDNPTLDARLLMQHVLRIDHAQIISQSERIVSPDEVAAMEKLMERRLWREPIARIFGERAFWSLSFDLNEATLEPRPDSETLVEAVLRKVKATPQLTPALRILDLGTGTGCLLLALLSELRHATGLGIDKAQRAVEQAQANALRNGLAERAAFQVGNWLEHVTGQFDILISNPPYISENALRTLQPEVRDYDPLLALDGGADGYAVYRHLIPLLDGYLTPNGIVAFEVGEGQAAIVSRLLQDQGFALPEIHRDLGGIERCVLATKSSFSP